MSVHNNCFHLNLLKYKLDIYVAKYYQRQVFMLNFIDSKLVSCVNKHAHALINISPNQLHLNILDKIRISIHLNHSFLKGRKYLNKMLDSG